ncbi:hypothetical protein GS399_09885 [Pedobacter sp. HMF7647]|uniref:2'-5' RNA ligase family protein n=1 Tax=Hufsiella arboris TaxID=2695275 RepID=A0A7K1YB48_9SPHI|nr:2'-5' RNA ligase family protein [Hufsiella arboris]MXV51278.1 hypothetical protein [Hufsiella arboris]
MKNLYFIAILPPEQLSEQIDDIRKECSEMFNVFAALKPPVHITLFAPFQLGNERENQLIKVLEAPRHHSSFEQELENFDTFNSHVVYINTIKNKSIASLQKNITAVMHHHEIGKREVKGGNTLFKPHITIAYRDIDQEIFPAMWAEYKNKKFKRQFTVGGFTLLKHDGKKWNRFKEYSFIEPMPELTLF